jgi:hypothetical protein
MVQWVVGNTPTPPTTEHIVLFPSEERCLRAAEKIKDEAKVPLGNVATYVRAVCFQRKDK